MKIDRVIISGGGTGGHIFPAIAIADEIKSRNPEAEILFIGAIGKMEMEKVPQAGYNIVGLDIRGFQRRLAVSNFLLPFKIIGSLLKARKVIKKFKPQVVVGVGGYASGPTLKMAQMLGIPTMLQEQNSYPGKTNKILAKKTQAICVAYPKMERFFPKEKVHLTGNPVRKSALPENSDQAKDKVAFGLDPKHPVILVIGGSLGARTLNESILQHLVAIEKSSVQVLWQVGKFYEQQIDEALKSVEPKNIKHQAFIYNMNEAYGAADVILSRAGALSVSELSLVGKPTILVPSPNVAEDHQTKNAMALVDNNAALLIKDTDAKMNLIPAAIELLNDLEKSKTLSQNLIKMGLPNATIDIVNTLEKLTNK